MLNACPNQKMPRIIMNIIGNTAAASAISAPRVSPDSLRKVLRAKFFILRNPLSNLLRDSPDVSNAIKNHSKRQGDTVRDFQRVWIVERNLRSRQPEGYQRKQNMTDIAHRL